MSIASFKNHCGCEFSRAAGGFYVLVNMCGEHRQGQLSSRPDIVVSTPPENPPGWEEVPAGHELDDSIELLPDDPAFAAADQQHRLCGLADSSELEEYVPDWMKPQPVPEAWLEQEEVGATVGRLMGEWSAATRAGRERYRDGSAVIMSDSVRAAALSIVNHAAAHAGWKRLADRYLQNLNDEEAVKSASALEAQGRTRLRQQGTVTQRVTVNLTHDQHTRVLFFLHCEEKDIIDQRRELVVQRGADHTRFNDLLQELTERYNKVRELIALFERALQV